MDTSVFKTLETFFLQHKSFRYRRRETILFTKDTPPGVFYLSKGYIRSYLLSKEGKELTVSILRPPDIFPMQWVINNMLTAHYYEALTEVVAYRASKESFLELLRQNPDAFFYITSKLLMKFHDVTERREAVLLGNAASKVAGILLFLAEYVGREIDNEMQIDIAFTHRDIASLIGLTRETVSLEMERFEKKGMIAHKSHQIIIKKVKELRDLSSID